MKTVVGARLMDNERNVLSVVKRSRNSLSRGIKVYAWRRRGNFSSTSNKYPSIQIKFAMLRTLVYVAVLLLTINAAKTATISVSPLGDSETAFVTVVGAFDFSDSDQFRQKVSTISKAIVAFQSDGGSVVAGIEIGRLIRLRNFVTLVPSNMRCASACALAWLGGTHRLMGTDAQIGFHAAYNMDSKQETGVGNALVGAYLSQIGLPDRAVIYVTQAPPNSMTWLTISEAQQVGIDVALFTPPNQAPEHQSKATPGASRDVVTMQRKATEFVSSLLKLWNSSDSSSVLTFLNSSYGPEVTYYGAVKDKKIILADKRKFMERWPQRNYQVRDGSMVAQCNSELATCDVSGIVDWDVSSPARSAISNGSANFAYNLNMASVILIVQESSVVLKRRSQPIVAEAQLPEAVRLVVSNKLRQAGCSSKNIPSKAVLAVDLNGDRIPDYVIEYDLIPCNETSLAQALENCGTGGCSVEIWMSRNDTWQMVDLGVLRGIEEGKTLEGHKTLLIATHGSSCNQVGYKSCFYAIWWIGEKFYRERVQGRKCTTGQQSWECETSDAQ
jgi:hypothetical protein